MVIIICIMLVWASIFYLLWSKADEVTKHPCDVCAKKLGENVYCWGVQSQQQISGVFGENVTR